MTAKNTIAEAAALLTRTLSVPTPPLGLDLDGTIDQDPFFFGLLSRLWPGEVHVITYRDDLDGAKADLDDMAIRYDTVVLVNSFEQKACEIERLGIGVYFDDMDEVITHIPDTVTVLKVRNGGNFVDGRWLYSNKTGRKV